jgi:hypothetical protein
MLSKYVDISDRNTLSQQWSDRFNYVYPNDLDWSLRGHVHCVIEDIERRVHSMSRKRNEKYVCQIDKLADAFGIEVEQCDNPARNLFCSRCIKNCMGSGKKIIDYFADIDQTYFNQRRCCGLTVGNRPYNSYSRCVRVGINVYAKDQYCNYHDCRCVSVRHNVYAGFIRFLTCLRRIARSYGGTAGRYLFTTDFLKRIWAEQQITRFHSHWIYPSDLAAASVLSRRSQGLQCIYDVIPLSEWKDCSTVRADVSDVTGDTDETEDV